MVQLCDLVQHNIDVIMQFASQVYYLSSIMRHTISELNNSKWDQVIEWTCAVG